MHGLVRIHILNWEKYQPRSDVKHSSWFRMEHGLYFDPEWAAFSALEHHVWVWLLACASMKNRGILELEHSAIATSAKVTVEVVKSALAKLEDKACIQIEVVSDTSRARNVDDTPASVHVALRTDGRDGRTNETDEESVDSDKPRSTRAALQELPILARLWNEHCGSLQKVRAASAKRRKAATARWRENPSEVHWIQVIERLAASKFCQGKNDRGWRATFDFLIQPETQHKALEGTYDDRAPAGRPGEVDLNALGKKLGAKA